MKCIYSTNKEISFINKIKSIFKNINKNNYKNNKYNNKNIKEKFTKNGEFIVPQYLCGASKCKSNQLKNNNINIVKESPNITSRQNNFENWFVEKQPEDWEINLKYLCKWKWRSKMDLCFKRYKVTRGKIPNFEELYKHFEQQKYIEDLLDNVNSNDFNEFCGADFEQKYQDEEETIKVNFEDEEEEVQKISCSMCSSQIIINSNSIF
ncbi:hypothetical protein DLAC_02289 [Tieghemostelium lacteum]|uniref:Uncharacterized protein n=1 Tax=Tieghemostelium lacteum TaxID=361077 RepID=A0A152A4L5_TIELA|nr:hypothetical protein DLAC_02289 [Tieghemostelium lacteum]|eukprot:KYR01180.1 hypothetical protein DLAC_02289 [Tieghemostelium lacteum]